MRIARDVSLRATCPARHVGALLVRDKRILATGYNGAPSGMKHCSEVGCRLEDSKCVRVIHAEHNAILQCALHGVSTLGSTLYTTHRPCSACTRLVVGAGIERVIYGAGDISESDKETFHGGHISLMFFGMPEEWGEI